MSSDFGRAWLIELVNDSIPGSVQAENIELAWFDGLLLRGVELRDPEGNQIARLGGLSADATLFQLATGDFALGTVKLEGVEADLVQDKNGDMNIVRALASGEPDLPDKRPLDQILRDLAASFPASLTAAVHMDGARITVSAPDLATPVVVGKIDVRIKKENAGDAVSFSLAAHVRQAPELDADFRLDAQLDGFDDGGRLDVEGAAVSVSAALGLSGGEASAGPVRLLRRWLGPGLDLSVGVTLSPDGSDVRLAVSSAQLEAEATVRASLFVDKRLLRLAQPMSITYMLRPVALEGLEPISLDRDVRVALTVKELTIPLFETDLSGVAFEAGLTIDDGQARVRFEEMEEFAWSGWKASLSTRELAREVRLRVEGRIDKDGQEGSAAVTATVRNLFDNPEFDATASLQDLPLDPLDRVVSTLTGRKGLLVEALGDRLNLSAVVSPASDGAMRVILTARSDRLDLSAPLTIGREAGTARAEDVRVDYRLPPSLVSRFLGPDSRVSLVDEVPIRIEVESWAAPLSDFDPSETSLTAKIAAGEGRLAGPDGDEIVFGGVSAHVSAPRFTETIAVEALAMLQHEGQRGSLTIEGEVRDLWDGTGGFQPGKLQGALTATLEDLPLAAVDSVLGMDGVIVEALGPSLDAKLTTSGGADRTQARLTIASKHLTADVPLVVDDAIRLGSKAGLRCTLTPGLVQKLVPEGQEFALEKAAAVALSLDRLSIPLGETLRLDRAALVAGLSVEDLTLRGLPGAERTDVKGLKLGLSGDSLASATVSASYSVEPAGEGGLLGTALGPALSVVVRGQVSLGPDGALEADMLRAHMESALLKLDMAARIDEKTQLVLAGKPLAVDYEIRPKLLQELGIVPTIAKPAGFRLEIDELCVPLTGPGLGQVVARGTASIPQAVLTGERRLEGTALQNIRLTVKVDKDIDLELAAQAKLPERKEPCSLSVTARARDWSADPAAAATTVRATVQRLPVALADALACTALGEEAKIGLAIDLPRGFDAGLRGTASLSAKTANLELSAELKLAQGISLARPATLRWTLKPRAFRALTGPGGKSNQETLALAKPAVVSVVVQDLRAPLPQEGKPLDLSRVAFDAAASVPHLSLRSWKTKQMLVLRGLELGLAANDLRKPLTVAIDGRVEDANLPGRIRGTLAFSGLVDSKGHLVSKKDGSLDLAALSTRADFTVTQLPVATFDRLLGMDELLLAVFGQEISAEATARLKRMRGPVGVKLTSGNARADVALKLTKRSVRLERPVEAQVTFTRRLGDLVLPKLGPLYKGMQSTGRPILLRIDSKGFYVPIDKFDLRRVRVPSATVDVGDVVLRSGWLTKAIKTIARAGIAQETAAWFTPLELEMRGCKILYKNRMDLLLDNSIHLATWGEVDLANDRLDMVLAFMPRTLKTLFGLRHAGPNHTLQLAIRGPVAHPKVNAAKAAKDIGLVIAKEKALSLAERRLPGLLVKPFRRALDKLLARILRGKPVPAPSVQPLPW